MKNQLKFETCYHHDNSLREFFLWILIGWCHIFTGVVVLLSFGYVGTNATLWSAVKLARGRMKKRG